MIIGIPKEILPEERRVAALPETIDVAHRPIVRHARGRRCPAPGGPGNGGFGGHGIGEALVDQRRGAVGAAVQKIVKGRFTLG